METKGLHRTHLTRSQQRALKELLDRPLTARFTDLTFLNTVSNAIGLKREEREGIEAFVRAAFERWWDSNVRPNILELARMTGRGYEVGRTTAGEEVVVLFDRPAGPTSRRSVQAYLYCLTARHAEETGKAWLEGMAAIDAKISGRNRAGLLPEGTPISARSEPIRQSGTPAILAGELARAGFTKTGADANS